MGAAAVPLMIGGTVLSTVGGLQQAGAEASAANYRAQVARNNAVIAERKAVDAIERGELSETQQRIKTSQLIGAQRASAAARGVEVDVGSVVDITTDTAAIGELDALTIRSNAEREALGFRTEGLAFESQAGFATAEARGFRAAAPIGALGTLASGAGLVSAKWIT